VVDLEILAVCRKAAQTYTGKNMTSEPVTGVYGTLMARRS